MKTEDVKALYDYSSWANGRLAAALSPLTTRQFTQHVAGSYGSVRNTIVHMLSAEWGWLERCGGPARGPVLAAADYPTVASVLYRWRQVEARVHDFLSTLRDADLERVVEFTVARGLSHSMPVWQLLHHAAIHGVHHRGQIAVLLRTLGHAPGNVDILIYYAELEAQRANPRAGA